jgi:serine/threonine protein kinase
MTPDPLTESMSRLDKKYQVLTELHHCAHSRTYLARHLELNRDVTITVARADGDKAFLDAYAADARILQTAHQPNIVPVLESTWLDDHTLAVVRTRMRGLTLEQTVAADGPLPLPRIAASLDELTAALIWARDAGVTNRCVEPETFLFQQGTGRVLIGFEPSPLIAGDAETIQRFGRTMNGGAPLDVTEYTARLGRPRVTPAAAATAAAMAAAPIPADREVAVPVGSDSDVVERPNRGMSFTARVLTTFGVIAALVVGALLFMNHRDGGDLRADAASSNGSDAGDVDMRSEPDTAAAYPQSYSSSQIVAAVPAPPPPNLDSIGRENEKRIAEAKAQARAMAASYGSGYGTGYDATGSTYPSSTYPSSTYPSSSSSSPTTNPASTTSPSTGSRMPASPAAARRPAIDTSLDVPMSAIRQPGTDSAGRLELLDPCGSPIGSDQSQCLTTAIEKADRGMSSLVQRVSDALRRQAGSLPGDPDPRAVDELHDAQHRWQQEREEACRNAGSGSFYAKERAACYADRAAQRKSELQRQLESIP